MLVLHILDGPGSGSSHVLTGAGLTVGTATDADVRVYPSEASLQEVKFRLAQAGEDGLVHVSGSSRVLVNGEAVRPPFRVGVGDVLELGGVKMVLTRDRGELPQAPSPEDGSRLESLGKTLVFTAHYIKNLLATVSAGSDLVDMALEEGDLDTARAGWGSVRQSLALVNDLVLNLLDYSKERRPTPRPVDLEELLESLAGLVRSRVKSRPITVRVDLRVSHAVLDPLVVHRAILNLLVNAVDAIPPGSEGHIVLGCRQVPGGVEFTVQDDGVGIPAESLPKVFDLFFSSKGNRGTGLGLAVSRKLVQEHGGTIELESQVGRGTAARIFIPSEVGDATKPAGGAP